MTDNGKSILQGRYALGGVIADGGMAQVFRARDEFLGRDVAVKVFRASATAETDFRRQEDEVNVVARLNHPNLVTLFDAAVDRSSGETRIYYVMELVEGTDLKRRLDGGPLVPRQVAQIGYYVATALEHVHRHGIVHRDVKPANILLTFNDDGTRVNAKLGDFGVASIGPAQPIGDDEVVTGTVAYLSPEQARGEEVGAPSDVYALGLVLLQCFSAELAFPGPPEASARARLLGDPPMPASVPEEWVPLLKAMTARETHDRPDIHDVALALRQMFAAETGRHKAEPRVSAEPGAAAEPSGRMFRPQRHDLPDDVFERITALAARALRTPAAILTTADHDRAWFTSADGLDIARIARDPLAAEELGLRFSARVPVTSSDGDGLGTLSVHDVDARTATDDEVAILHDLAALVARELELRRDALALVQGEASWFDAPDVDTSGSIITNRSSTGPIEVPAS